jgi:hypothetical protein
MGPDAVGTDENESVSANHENETRRTRHSEPDAPGTAENESGSAKPDNETRHTQHRRKRVRERKT